MTTLPAGTVTFLFTDLEGSTRLWEEHPTSMRAALARHDELLRDAVAQHDGVIVKTTGDGVHAVFMSPVDALAAAVAAQRALAGEPWDGIPPLRVRMGVHTGVAELREGDYYGSTPNRAARLMSIANGGQVVCSSATASLARDALSDDLALRDLGEHRLRDLSQPDHVFQVEALGLQEEFPPLASLRTAFTNLPRQHTSFLGRDAEVAETVALCSDHPLVTITGVGGVGKTRLALQAAAKTLPRFRDGVWLCELAPAREPEAVAAIVGEVLDARPRGGLSAEEVIVEVLRTRELLIILDNCEHVLDAAADLVSAVVDACPDVRVLATSREGLAIDGERVRPLRSLAVPDDNVAAAASSAVQLFTDRARTIRDDFTLDDDNVVSVVEICRRLDGIPLAIELAAARVVAMQPQEIASHLDERFRLLTGNRRRAVERHQTLRATVEWSYSLLSPTEQAVFDRLSVFAGSFDADAATAVASEHSIDSWEVRDAIESLVAKSMVIADVGPSATRYWLLETLRTYARDRLEETGDADAWRRRHADYYTALATRLGARIHGPDETVAMRAIREELDNLRTATFWSLDSDDDHGFALEIVADLGALVALDRSTGVAGWADQAVAYLDEATPGRAATILSAAAWYSLDRGDTTAARERALGSLPVLYEPGSMEPTASLVVLAVLGLYFGDEEPVAAMLDHMTRFETTEWSEYHLSALCSSFAAIAPFFPDLAPLAVENAERSLAIALRCGNPTALANALFAMGLTHEADPDTASAFYDQSIALIESGATDTVLSHAHRGASRVARLRGDMASSIEHLIAAIEHADRVGDHPSLGNALDETVFVLCDTEDVEGSTILFARTEAGVLNGLLLPDDARRVAANAERARVQLGEDVYAAAHHRGATMSERELVAFALDRLEAVARQVAAG